MQKEKIIILGSGPAGLTAGLYAARANLEPLIITGNEIGGQVSITNEVENYPAFPEGTTGPELVDLMRRQAEKFGARTQIDEVIEVDLTPGSPFHLRTHAEEYQAHAVIICTGASPRRLGVPGEEEFIGRGVSFCATCDGFFFRDKDVVVVGGGDSALEEGLFLTKFASRVRIVHRRDELRAGPVLAERAEKHEKISFVWDTVVEEVVGNGAVESIAVKNVKTGAQQKLATDGVFVFIGHYPNTGLFKDQLEMDPQNYLVTDHLMTTSVAGVYAAGEVQDPVFRQVVSSAGQGCQAAISAERWLAAQGIE